MSREIKFRVWDENKAQYWSADIKEVSMRFDGLPLFWTGDECYIAGKFWPPEWVREQFTGLKDRDGREIYEGDILLDSREACAVKWDDYSAVVWESNGWRLQGSKQNTFGWIGGHWTKDSVVAGNIHENQDLLTT